MKIWYRMKNGQSECSDKIPVETWKVLQEDGIDLLWDFYAKVFTKKKIPERWERTLVPNYNGKRDVQDCRNYLRVNLMSNTENPRKTL